MSACPWHQSFVILLIAIALIERSHCQCWPLTKLYLAPFEDRGFAYAFIVVMFQ